MASDASDNFYLFTGRRVDILDNGSLKIQYNRNRYYDYYTGRWLSHDPLGITPNAQTRTAFVVKAQYALGNNLYQYCFANPIVFVDGYGLAVWTPWITLVDEDITVTVFNATVVGPYTYTDLTGPFGCGPRLIDGKIYCCDYPNQWYLGEVYNIWGELKVDAKIHAKVEARWSIYPFHPVPQLQLTASLKELIPDMTAKKELIKIQILCLSDDQAESIENESSETLQKFEREYTEFEDNIDSALDALQDSLRLIDLIREYYPWL